MARPADLLERIEWFRYNRNATTKDRITLYACKHYTTECDTAHYKTDGHGTWTLTSMPREYDREDYPYWANLKWPASLRSDELAKLARGWALRGGFAATREAAVAYRLERARGRIEEISRELRDAHAFVRDAEGMVAA